jgi:IclR family KDG regulon transcriptional repressor
MKRPKSDYEIQTVRNAFRLLEAFRDHEELGVTELSRILALHKNNVFRLLATLEQAGYVEQSRESDRYRLGVRCVELGQSHLRNRELLRLARPHLERLARDCGEAAHVGVLRDFEVVHLEGAKARRLVQSSIRVGINLPAHCTALGKVLLACSEEGVREHFDRAVLRAEGLEGLTASTIVDPDKFREHLHSVASQGFALDLEECEPGLCCASVPIFGSGDSLMAAFSVSAPVFRADGGALERKAVPALVEAADQLSRQLGAAR